MAQIDLSPWLIQNYGFTELPDVNLIRSYTNDVYQVTTSTEKYILKVYGVSWRTAGEVQYEIELLNHLAQEGVPVSKPVRGTGKAFVKQVSTVLSKQNAVLFEYAEGEKPQPPFDCQLYFQFGEAIGKMHEFSNRFVAHYPRKNIDLETLIDQPLQVILPLFEDRPQEAAAILSISDRVKRKIHSLSQQGLDWGPIHGDATLDNLHISQNQQITLYDFDSGGPGWRASDLQGWAIAFPEYQERYDSFLNGYRQVRAVKDIEIEASWYITLAWDIWGMKIDLERRVLKQGQAGVHSYLSEQIQQLREREKSLP